MSGLEQLIVSRVAFHDFDVRGDRVLLHVPSTSVFVLDPIAKDVLDYVKAESLVTREAIFSRLKSHSPENISGAIDDFFNLGILQIPGVLQNQEFKDIREFPLSTIVLNVNTGCNLSCTYCYKEDLDIPSEGKRLSLVKAIKGIELLIKEGASRDRINVVFFGGEPLSNFELIRQVTEYAERRCSEETKQIDFSLTTNATLLTEELIEYFDVHRFGISISMDGPEAIHDRRRLTVGGNGTYSVVRKKAKLLLERYKSKPVGARVTLTSGYTDVCAIHKHLKDDLGFAEVGYAPVTSNPVDVFNLSESELRSLDRKSVV